MVCSRTILWMLAAASLLGGCHSAWRIAACTSNAQGQCGQYAQHAIEREVTRDLLPMDFTARFPECADGFARVEFHEQSENSVLVRVTCRVSSPTDGGGITLPEVSDGGASVSGEGGAAR